MITKDWTEGFPEAWLQDERILSAREKELLANVLRQARSDERVSGTRVAEIMARAIGETVMQRASSLVGEKILHGLEAQTAGALRIGMGPLPVPTPPPSPNQPGPRPPSPDPPTSPNSIRVRSNERAVAPFVGPHPPKGIAASDGDRDGAFIGPRPPSTASEVNVSQEGGVAVMEIEERLPANCVIFEEFLIPSDLDVLTRFTLEHEADFRVSQVLSPGVQGGRIDHEHRRSRVLSEPGEAIKTLVDRVKACLPRILPKLGAPLFPVAGEEAQITASNHGDFFRWHSDNAQEEIATREITFVYFFHREPKRFQGGELRIYDSERREGMYVPTENYRAIVPRQNQIVFFRSSLAHEITPVECPSGEFGDSRFTVNGWFHR